MIWWENIYFYVKEGWPLKYELLYVNGTDNYVQSVCKFWSLDNCGGDGS